MQEYTLLVKSWRGLIFWIGRFDHCIQHATNARFCNSHLASLALHLHLITIPLHITITSHYRSKLEFWSFNFHAWYKFWSYNDQKYDSWVSIESPNWKTTKKKVSTIMYTCMSWVLTTSDYELLIIIGLFLVNLNYVHKVIGWGYDLCENCVHLIQFGDKSINWFPTKLVKISW